MSKALTTLIIVAAVIVGLIILFHLLLWIFWLSISLTISMKKEYKKTSKFYNWVFVLWYRYMMIVGMIRLHVTGYEKVPFGTHFLLVSNHRSKFDNFVQCAVSKKLRLHIFQSLKILRFLWADAI